MSLRGVVLLLTAALLGSACAGGSTLDDLADSTALASTDAIGTVVVRADTLRLVDRTGAETQLDVGDQPFQPTWSRDGSRLVVATSSPSGPFVEVFNGDTGVRIDRQRASRSYFFFSWSSDGRHIAALGNGPRGTTLDILDEQGRMLAGSVAAAGSLFVAWEPDGDRLIAHGDQRLFLMTTDFEIEDLGEVGSDFYAPKWIPGTGDVMLTGEIDGERRLIRRTVETGSTSDLGPIRGATGIVVHPDGGRAVLVHTSAIDDGGITSASFRPVQTAAAVEVIDLDTGDRNAVIESFAWWAEWSPSGDQLLLATIDSSSGEGEWIVWNGESAATVAEFTPTPAFFTRYMVFSDQYIEQPRLWSFDGTAFVYPDATSRGDRVFVVDSDGQGSPVDVGPGAVAFWSQRVSNP